MKKALKNNNVKVDRDDTNYFEGKNKSGINVISNIIARLWSMVSVYIFVPFYIKYLGEESYGLITFFATLQGMLNIFGVGLSKVLRREYASLDNTDTSQIYKYKLLRSMEVVFLFFAVCIVLACYFFAGFITDNWLNIVEIPRSVIEKTIRIMGLVIALQIFANLYFGGIMGLGRQFRANLYQIAWSTFRSVSVLVALAIFRIDIITLYVIFAICDFIYMNVMRCDLPKLLFENKCRPTWKLSDVFILKKVYKIAVSLILVALFSTLNGQIDKFIISAMLSLTDLGAYNLAYSLSHISYSIALALSVSASLNYSKLFGNKDYYMLLTKFLSNIKAINIFLLTIGIFTSVFSKEIILMWSNSQILTNVVAKAAPIIILGTTLQATQVFPYEFLIACGNTKPINTFVIINSILILLLSPILIKRFGLLGAGISWLISMIILTFCYYIYINKKYVKKNFMLYISTNFFLPSLIILCISLASKLVIGKLTRNLIITIIAGITIGLLTLIFIYMIFDKENAKMIFYKYKTRRRKKNETTA